jgi:hypothetical protein
LADNILGVGLFGGSSGSFSDLSFTLVDANGIGVTNREPQLAGGSGWQYYSASFIAQGTQTKLQFRDEGEVNSFGGLLDDVSIVAVEKPEVSISVDTMTVAEDGGIATFLVTRTGSTLSPLAVDLLLRGLPSDATRDVDYEFSDIDVIENEAIFIIPAGQSSGSFTLASLNDQQVEGDEPAQITISSGESYTLAAASSAEVTIVDDDWLDLDIDSDNNNGFALPAESEWEETLEVHSYALGKLIMLDNPTRPLTPFVVTLRKDLDPDDPAIRVKIDWDVVGLAGTIKIWGTGIADEFRDPAAVDEGGDRVFPDFAYSLVDLGYDPDSGTIILYAEGTEENTIIKTLAGLEGFGKPDERIKATILIDDVEKGLG